MGGPASGGEGEIISAIFNFVGSILTCLILLMAAVPVCEEKSLMMSEKNNIILTPNPTLSSLCGPQCKTMKLSVVEETLDCGLLFTAM